MKGEDVLTLRLEEQGRDAKAVRGYVKKPKETRRECCVRRCICQPEEEWTDMTDTFKHISQTVGGEEEEVRRGGWDQVG